MTKKEIEKVIKLYEEGLNVSQIYKEMAEKREAFPKIKSCKEEEAQAYLRDNFDKKYFFKDKEKAREYWRKYNYVDLMRENRKKPKQSFFDYYLKDNEGNWQLLIQL